MRSKWIKTMCVIGILICACMGCGTGGNTDQLKTIEESVKEDSKTDVEEEGKEDTDKESTIYVHVCGQVTNPGVYELEADSRVFESIEAAGGLTSVADSKALNQAQILEDGQQIYVPSAEETAQANQGAGGEQAAEDSVDDGKVDLNKATKEQLMTLTGIGEVKAMAILSYRESKGSFQNIEELMEVEGIKEGTYDKIKDQIKV